MHCKQNVRKKILHEYSSVSCATKLTRSFQGMRDKAVGEGAYDLVIFSIMTHLHKGAAVVIQVILILYCLLF